MNYLVVDIETIPDQSLPEELKPECKTGNLRDEKKIIKKQEEWKKEGQVKAMSLDPLTNQIIYIGLWTNQDGFIEFENQCSEKDMIIKFWESVKYKDYIVGKNHIAFDLPTIINRSMLLNIKPTIRFNLSRYQTAPLFDVQQILSGRLPSNWKSLNWLAKRFGIEDYHYGLDVIEGNYEDSSMIYEWWKAGKKDIIAYHCHNDVWRTKEIFNRLIDYYREV